MAKDGGSRRGLTGKEMKAKKLIEVALPIKEISAESVRDKSIRHGHISTLHQWWARRPLPVCRAAVFASVVPDPLDENCPKAFGEAIDALLNAGVAKNIYKPYADIPYTAVYDPVEDNRRNRLLAFIGQFSDKCQKNMLQGRSTSPKEQLSDYSLIKWESKDKREVVDLARKLIWVAYNAERFPDKSYAALSKEFDVARKAIADAENALYGTVDRHLECKETTELERELQEAIDAFQKNMPSVFDPFSGGGAIPLEAARLGCRSYGNDINPVAHIIEKGSAEFPQKYGKPIVYSKSEFERIYGDDGVKLFAEKGAEDSGWRVDTKNYYLKNRLSFDVEFYAKKILKETELEEGYLYPADEMGRKPVAYYWVRTAKCGNPSCGAEVPLLKDLYICNTAKKKVYLDPIVEGKSIRFDLKTGDTSKKGFLKHRGCSLTCPCCGSVTEAEEIKRDFVLTKNYGKLLAVISEGERGKSYRLPTKNEIELSQRTFDDVEEFRPTERMPVENNRNFNTPGWGFSRWGDLFSNRQLHVLHAFLKNFEALKPQTAGTDYGNAVLSYLAIWIDRIAIANTSFGVYHTGREKLERIMGRQAVAMTFDYPESNPFCGLSGSAENQLNWIIRYFDSESRSSFPATFANASSGDKLQFGNKSLTAVVTDPPYYDAIAYADCSDFFYVWLKRTLNDIYPLVYATPQTPKAEECTALKHHQGGTEEKAKKHFERKLTQIFDAIETQTSDVVSIMFAHQSTEAWTTLCNSILGARMNITGSWPMDTEMQGALKTNMAYLESSVTVSCRPSEQKGFGDFAEVKAAIEKKVAAEVESLYQLGFRGADLLTACFGQAVGEFGHYKTVEKADGSEVTVGELLELARNAAFNALLKGVQGDVYTRFYIGWLQMNGVGEADYDDVTKFTRVGLPVNIQEIIQKGLIVSDKKHIHLVMAAEHLKDKAPSVGTRLEDSLIEQAHRAMLLYKSEDRAALLRLVKNVAQDVNGPFWRLLASLKELLPANDDLKQVEGLLQNAKDLRESSKGDLEETQGTLELGI